MANISFFFPKAKQGGALGINGGPGNMGVSVMQLIAPLAISVSIFAAFGGGGVTQPDGSVLFLQNASGFGYRSRWSLPAAWFFMNDLSASKASLSEQLPVLKRGHLWVMALLYLATFGSFIGFSAGFAMLSKTQFPDADPSVCLLRSVYRRAGTFAGRDDLRPSGRDARYAGELCCNGHLLCAAVPDAACGW